MARVLADRVQDTTTTTGTGTLTLANSPPAGFQGFSAVGNGNSTFFCTTDGTDWEVAIGTYTSSGHTLTRSTILASSNSGSAVNWGAGTKDVFVTMPAGRTAPKVHMDPDPPSDPAEGDWWIDTERCWLLLRYDSQWIGLTPIGGASGIASQRKWSRVLAAAETSNSTTEALIADANGDWTIPVVAGKTYCVKVLGTYSSAASTTGCRLNVTAVSSAAGTINGYARGTIVNTAANSALDHAFIALPFSFITTGMTASGSGFVAMEFVFVCTTSGSLEIRWGSEVGSSNAVLAAGSALIWEEL